MKDHELDLKFLEKLLKEIDPEINTILNEVIDGKNRITTENLTDMFQTTGINLQALILAADFLQKQANNDVVTFVINRNINFTNICTAQCKFCAFSVPSSSPVLFDTIPKTRISTACSLNLSPIEDFSSLSYLLNLSNRIPPLQFISSHSFHPFGW